MRYLIRNGEVIDGTGRRAFASDVLIEDGRIAEIAPSIAARDAEIIDASGRVVTPGFIDIHRHCDVAPLSDPGFGEIELRQGITTTIVGNCGLTPAPAPMSVRRQLYDYLEPVIGEVSDGVGFDSFRDYAKAISSLKLPLNMGFLAGVDSVKAAVKGFSSSPYTSDEISRAAAYVDEAMQAGAFGGSLGIMYLPECYSTASEIAQVVSPIAAYDGILSTHIRGEGDSLVDSVEEVLEIAR